MSNLDPLKIRRVLGRNLWGIPQRHGPDGWRLIATDGLASIIVTCADHDGDDWIHASIARTNSMPTYEDLTMLHAAVFSPGWSYQVFAPPADHVNIHQTCLHLWGRLDGKPGLPDFAEGMGTI